VNSRFWCRQISQMRRALQIQLRQLPFHRRGFASVRLGHCRLHVIFPGRLRASITDCAMSVW
jgi:hypothetical protein